MNKSRVCRLLAALLAAASLLTLAACKAEDAEPEKVRLTNVFSYDAIPIPPQIQNVERAVVSDDKIFFYGSGYDEVSQVYTNALYAMNFDGSDVRSLFEMVTEQDEEKKIYRSRYIQSMAVDGSGNLWFSENEYYDDYSDPNNPVWEQNCFLKKVDEQGEALFEVNCKELVPDMEYFNISYMVFDEVGNLFVAMENTVYILDKDNGSLLGKLEQEGYINSLVSSGSGEVYISGWGTEGNMELRKVDTAARAWGETISVSNNNMYNLLTGTGEYDFYYQDSTAVYGYKVATEESVEVLNWINSDINSERMNTVVPLEDGRMIAMQWREQEGDPMLFLMSPRDPDTIPEVMVITYATMWLNSDVRSAIINFNRSQEEYRIQVLDYYKYSTSENWRGGYERLNMDIVSGNVPDIINLESLNIDSYINKGLLADIYTFIDNDPDMSREDYLPNIMEAASRDGKLYQLIPTFSLFTVIGKSALVGDTPGWTMGDLLDLMDTLPEGTQAFSEMTRGSILSYSTMMAMDQFINYETGQCSFDSEAFIGLLEFANQFDEEIDWEALYGDNYDWEAVQNAYKDDQVILLPTSVYSVRSVRDYRDQFGDDITFIGFPTANKNGSCIMPSMQLGLSAKSKNQDAAWQFLRTFLTEEYYNIGNGRYYYGLPLNKNVLERQIELEKIPLRDRDNENGDMMITRAESVNSASSWNYSPEDEDEFTKNYHLTDAEADQIWQLITSVNTLTYSDTEISTILSEEVEYYFQGSKTAQEVAQVIQSKIQTYINESR